MVEADSLQLTEAEAQLYDRQIRLWGLESQKRLRNARVLIIGLGGLGAEVSKNIILTGVKSVTLMDHVKASEADSFSQFFIPRDSLGQSRATASMERAKILNPLVEVTAEDTNFADLPDEFYTNLGQKFDIVIATSLQLNDYIRIDEMCRKSSVQFFAGDVFGMFGFLFIDLNKFNFVEDVPCLDTKTTKVVKQELDFPSLSDALTTKFDNLSKREEKRLEGSYFLMRLLMEFRKTHNADPEPNESDINTLIKMRDHECSISNISVEKIPDELIKLSTGAALSPACAIMGAVLAQEMVKAISHKESPHRNMFFFNPVKSMGHVQFLGPA